MKNFERLNGSVSSHEDSNLPQNVGTALVLTSVFTALETKFNALGLPASSETAVTFFTAGTAMIGIGALNNLALRRRNRRGQ